MPSVATWNAFEFVSNDGSVMASGSLDVPVIVPAASTLPGYSAPLTLATNAKGVLWDAAVGPSDFSYLYILSDTGDATGWVMIETTTDEAGAFGTRYQTFALAAGIPFVLAASASYANYTQNFGGGTLSKIQKVRAQNLNTGTANISIKIVL